MDKVSVMSDFVLSPPPIASPVDPSSRIELLGLTKRYGQLLANDQISLKVTPGEIHALLGENGAGKSTLMKMIYGVVQPDAGQILWNGHEVQIANPAAARKLGIGMVYQHFSLFESLTVAQNMALVSEQPYDLDQLSRQIREVSERYGLPLDPQRHVHSLSVGERQRVEIVRCLLQSPSLLILDEPTSVLTPPAVLKLFETLRQLSSEGVSIIYISHKLHEIQTLCDRATILRGGKVTGTAIPSQESTASLAEMMIGRQLPQCSLTPYTGQQQPVLNIQHLSVASPHLFGTALQDIELAVNQGEIVGIAGISGNGQAELLAALSGEHPVAADQIMLSGKPVGQLDAGERRQLGLGFVPEERLGRGAVPDMSLRDNTLLTAHHQGLVSRGLIRFERLAALAQRCIAEFDVRCRGEDSRARSLSGGNLQKFIVGREILQEPRLLIVAQPTWGVDVGAAAFIRQQLIDLSRRGVAVLVISEELDELFEICDRIAVLANGRLSPAQATAGISQQQIGLMMAGLIQDQAGTFTGNVVSDMATAETRSGGSSHA